MLTEQQRAFLAAERVARLATADAAARPHVVPVCYALVQGKVYFTIDEKPKKKPARLKRLANLRANPVAALVVDRYDEDWSRLGWVMLQGAATILESGPEHDAAQAVLRARYPQLAAMRIEDLPVVAVRIDHVASWGRLEPDGPRQDEDGFATRPLGAAPDVLAPDGSEGRILCQTGRGSMAHFALAPGAIARAVTHRTIDEVWYVVSGRGRMWRRAGGREEVVELRAGLSLSLPCGTAFQFRADGAAPLAAVGVAMPPWPGEDEAYMVEGPWQPTV
jgi:PPOX class probable F420-dependent enzyme